jgi:hypothetical protein
MVFAFSHFTFLLMTESFELLKRCSLDNLPVKKGRKLNLIFGKDMV